ncbi:MAG: phosphoglucosamine mutase [Campylobacterales bacterium]|nr:phosphoglucosamine mutase [Campylobacterales bacterium]
MKLFGTDGVRGKAGKFLTAQVALRLAMASGIYFRKHAKTNKILVGKDTRRSGYMIENAIVSGLTAVGYDVIQVGPLPTPAVAFLTEDMRCDGGIMISASHNPFGDNGIKFFDNNGNKLDVKDEDEIEKIYNDSELIEKSQQIDLNIGSAKRIDDVIGRYIVHIKNSFPKNMTMQGLRIVVDCANGAAYKVAPTIFKELGADVIVLSDEPNGVNINEGCGALHPSNLAECVLKYRADIGIALDGDADRLVVVDEKGNSVDGDKLIGVLAKHLKEQSEFGTKNSAIVATTMSNMALEEFLENQKIKLYRSDVGDKYVLDLMNKYDLIFGGEQSGHIIFKEYAKTGDGLVSALQVISYLIKSKTVASKALDIFKLYPSKLQNINVSKKIPLDEIEGYSNLTDELNSQKLRYLIRYSGTENKLRILIEAQNDEIIEENLNKVITFFKSKLND